MRKTKSRKTQRASFVRNAELAELPKTTSCHPWLVGNAATKMVRNETLEGRPHIVVNMIMMVEGVHNGTLGPLYYSAEELSKVPAAWNQKPVCIYHPDGETACSKEEVDSRKVGVIMNAHWTSLGQLKAEAWLEESRVKEIDERVWNAIQNKKMLELSTGLWTENDMEEGEWEGEKYVGVAKNFRPDHLAILPDRKGACGIKDGAGFLRNELQAAFSTLDSEDHELLRDRLIKALQNDKSPAVQSMLKNEQSYEQIKCQLYEAVTLKYPSNEGFAYPWIEAVYDSYFVYSIGGMLNRMDFSTNGDKITISGTPQKVVRVTEYKTVSNAAQVSNEDKPSKQPNKGNQTMDKKHMVTDLISNHGYSEEDRGYLEGLDDKSIARAHKAAQAVANKAAPAVVVAAKNADPVVPKADQVLNSDQMAALSYGQRRMGEDRAAHITKIKANPQNKLTDAVLNSMPIDTLEAIAGSVVIVSKTDTTTETVNNADFSGMGHVHVPVTNAQLKSEDALVTPSWDSAVTSSKK